MKPSRKDRVREALHELRPGAELVLGLDDGREVRGVLLGIDGEKVSLAGLDERIDIGRVEHVVIEARTEGPE